jgi:hypothetical protein
MLNRWGYGRARTTIDCRPLLAQLSIAAKGSDWRSTWLGLGGKN